MNGFRLALDNVSFHYQNNRKPPVLRGINLRLEKGDRLAVVGGNGTGKSTLLRIIARIYHPSAGAITVEGSPSIRLLNVIPGFHQENSGRDNAILSCLLQGKSRKEAEAVLPEIIAFAELEDWMDEPLRTYSTGMMARLGFAVALASNPDILLIDETLSVGDARFQRKAITAMENRLAGIQTAVVVTHDLRIVENFCSRAVWLAGGRIKLEGSVPEVNAAYLAWVAEETAASQPETE